MNKCIIMPKNIQFGIKINTLKQGIMKKFYLLFLAAFFILHNNLNALNNNALDEKSKFSSNTLISAISGIVFNDTDCNGVYNLDESGIPNITIIANSTDGTTITMITNADGFYGFDGFPNGEYTITLEGLPLGVEFCTPEQVYTRLIDEDININFGIGSPIELHSISGTVFFDKNCDGVLDLDEPGIPIIEIIITFPDGTVNATTTDCSGEYNFINIPDGTYTITVVGLFGGIGFCTNSSTNITLLNESITEVNFGIDTFIENGDCDVCTENSVTQGTVVTDSTCISPTDTLNIDNLEIQITSADATYTIDITNGAYELNSILSGVYTVDIPNLDTTNYVFYTEGNTSTILLAAEDTANIDFTICSTENDDCLFDPYYYYYIECNSSLTIMGPDTVNYNWYKYPDYNTSLGTSNSLTISNTDNSDLKIYKAVSIEDTSCYGEYVIEYFSEISVNGFAFIDFNQNGEYNYSETPKEGVTIYLSDENNIIIDSTMTDTDGNYSFPCLEEGIYIVNSNISTEFLTTYEEYTIDSTSINIPNFGCKDTVNLARCPSNSMTELPCDSILTLTVPYYKEDSIYNNLYSWYDQTEPSAILYKGDKFTVPININSTVTYVAKRTKNNQDEICSMHTVTYLPCENKCLCEFDINYAVVCKGTDQYELMIFLDSIKEILIIDNNNPEIVIGPFNIQNISLGLFDIPNGFSYDIYFSKDNCTKTINQSLVDCQNTAVELLRFDGQAMSNGNLVEWVTASENDIDAFILEYSKDGYNFEKITESNATGNSNTTQTYNHLHQITKSGTHYYKLSSKDHSGNIQPVSRIIEIERTGDLIELHLYPNPISDVLNLEIISTEEKEANIQIYNYLGALILQQNFVINAENNIRAIQTNELISGSYFIKISTNDVSMIQKFIKN